MYQINFYICIAKSCECGILWNYSTLFHNMEMGRRREE